MRLLACHYFFLGAAYGIKAKVGVGALEESLPPDGKSEKRLDEPITTMAETAESRPSASDFFLFFSTRALLHPQILGDKGVLRFLMIMDFIGKTC